MSSSSGVGARSTVPMTARRTLPWPMRSATFGPTPRFSSAARCAARSMRPAAVGIGDDGRDALREERLALLKAFACQPLGGVGMDVDETGRNDAVGGVDRPNGLRLGDSADRADRTDSSAGNADVGAEPGIARAVEHPAATDQQVERPGRLRVLSRGDTNGGERCHPGGQDGRRATVRARHRAILQAHVAPVRQAPRAPRRATQRFQWSEPLRRLITATKNSARYRTQSAASLDVRPSSNVRGPEVPRGPAR